MVWDALESLEYSAELDEAMLHAGGASQMLSMSTSSDRGNE